MTEEERKAKDAARKREAYARRKKAQAELSNKLPTPQEELALRIAQANGIDVPPGVLYQDHREHARAVQAESVAREEYIDLLFSKFERCTNIPQLLQAILREQITLRVTLTDLIGGLRK
jgi:hypothetical protein